jgi:outer membrane protein assembly factor BamB
MNSAAFQIVVIGIKGTVLGLDAQSGSEVWRQDLKGIDFVNLVVSGDQVLASTKGEIFCLDRGSGMIRWHNPLKGLGRGLVTIAAGDSSATMAIHRERLQREEAAAASAAAAGAAASA